MAASLPPTQVARGMLYLHELKPRPIVHRDLKPAVGVPRGGAQHACLRWKEESYLISLADFPAC